MKKHLSTRLLSLLLAAVLLLGLGVPVRATETGAASRSALSFQQVDNSEISAGYPLEEALELPEAEPAYAGGDLVRVSIVLDKLSTLGAGFSTQSIGENAAAMVYRAELRSAQAATVASIEKALGGKLDVVWNLTLAANIISANVPYGDLAKIEALRGVREVVLETRYEPAVVDTNEAADPNMATSTDMIGSGLVWGAGYTGAGTRIAIIDTGIDTDHQSFSASGFAYSLAYEAGLKQMTPEEYARYLNLLDEEEIAEKLPLLNIRGVSAEELYVSGKIPFGFNYVDQGLDITHDHDTATEHGSHVAGIAAANKYIPTADGGFAKALDAVKVQGVAPDAQIITMKVFGKSGGAYDSDYMAAIEDAIVLGADSINLSLGSAYPGFSYSTTYQAVMESLAESDTVVTFSCGNAYSWPEYSFNGTGYLYSDDVSLSTAGSPGSFTNAFTVASVDNVGFTGMYLQVGDDAVFYNESAYSNEPFVTLAGEQSYVLIDGVGTAEEFAAIAGVLAGKIAVCSRGETAFSEKANAAVANGAIATIIYNNQAGSINMDLSDYAYTAPCISISQADGAVLKAAAQAVPGEDGETACYVGTMRVADEIETVSYDPDYYTMSSFSSWGVPGSLILKPEITAPGGSIYSVNGQAPGGQSYENMSGTSMAAPQVAGMAALVAQYIRENGLEEKAGVSPRVLAQSLLMSTAAPVLEEASGSYWSILKQGAGLANVNDAITADSFLLMEENATASWADGKVKAELGDDPERTGQYTFSFSIHNLTDSTRTYTLASDFFTQALLEQDGETYLDTRTTVLPVDVTYTVDGAAFVPSAPFTCDLNGDGSTDAADAQVILNYAAGLTDTIDAAADLDGDGAATTYDAYLLLDALVPREITVAPGGEALVTVDAVLPETVKTYLNENYVNGAYLEGYVYVIPTTTEEGVIAPTHSIPVLGFYGNWTDPSMFDQVTTEGYLYGDETAPYTSRVATNNLVVNYPGTSTYVYYLTNRYLPETPAPTERRAVNSGTMLYAYYASLIRNASAVAIVVTDGEGNVLELTDQENDVLGAYLHTTANAWQNTLRQTYYYRMVSSLGLKEGDTFTVNYVAIPEYYAPGGGVTREQLIEIFQSGRLGKGACLSTTLTVDDTAPEITAISKDLMTDQLIVTAKDNQYIAAVMVYDNNGMELLASTLVEQTEAGVGGTATLDLAGMNVGEKCLVRVADYAGNETTYRLTYGGQKQDYTGRMFGFMSTGTANYRGTGMRWIEVFPETLYYYSGQYDGTKTVAPFDVRVIAADYVGGYVYMYATNGYLYVAPQGDWTNYQSLQYIGTTPAIRDMAFNYADGKLYAMMDDNLVCSIDLVTGELTEEFRITITNPKTKNASYLTLQGLAIDDEGTFYSINQSTRTYAFLYKWTREDAVDGVITDLAPVNNTSSGTIGTYDFRIKACLAWDHDGDILYLSANSQTSENVGSSNELLAVMNTQTGKASLATDYDGGSGGKYAPSRFYSAVSGLYIVPARSVTLEPSDQVSKLTLNETELPMLLGATKTLQAEVFPWTLSDRSVVWSSQDESVATVSGGVVTAVGLGETTITAAAKADPTVTRTCTVTVTAARDVKVSALITDAGGKSYWAQFHTADPDGWTKLSGETGSYYAGGYLAYDQRLIVHDNSHIYSVDPDSFAVTDFGELHSDWMWTDAAEAPSLGEERFGYLAGISNDGRNFCMINPMDGRVGYWGLFNLFGTDPMTALAFTGITTYGNYDALEFYVLTEGGRLMRFCTYYTSTTPTLYYENLGNVGLTLPGAAVLGSGKRASMVYDQETGYLVLAHSQPGQQVRLYAIDPVRVTAAPLGAFDQSVSAVTSLYQYEQVTDLTIRMRPDTATIYSDETVAFEAHVLPVSYTDQVTWSSSDPSVATVDENGLVSGVSAGTVTITATSVATDESGQPATASAEVEVLALAHIDTELHAQITTEEGDQWVTIDASDVSNITVEGTAKRQFTAGGAHDGKLYGIPTDYETTSPFYVIDPSQGFAEESGAACYYTYAPLDMTTAPADTTTVTKSDGSQATLDTFNYPVYVAFNKYLVMLLDPYEGSITGWTNLNVSDAAAIAYEGVGVFAMAGNAKTQNFIVLGANGGLYRVQIWPNYNKTTGVLGYTMTRSVIGSCGMKFADDTKLSMTYVDDGVNKGLIVANSDGAAELYYIDLSDKTPHCTKMGTIPGATAISSLYTDRDLGTAVPEETEAVTDPATVFSPWCAFDEPIPQAEASIALNPADTAANEAGGSVHAAGTAAPGAAEAPEAVTLQGKDVTVKLSEAVDVTNGLVQVRYDPAVLTFTGADTLLPNHAVNDTEAGTLIFDYAQAESIQAGAVLAELHFTFVGDPEDTAFTVETRERNRELTLTASETLPVDTSCKGGADCPTAQFEDLSSDAWYHEYTDFVIRSGLMVGISDTRFAPDLTTTRGQLVTILYRMAGKPETAGENPFVDVAGGRYYTKAVIWAAEQGIVLGVDADHFAPNQPITREQMVAMLYRYAVFCGIPTTATGDLSQFPDGNRVSRYAVTAMEWAVETGLIQGMDGTLNPRGEATRVQIAAVITRFSKLPEA